MILLVILVSVLLMVPLIARSTRGKRQRRVRWQGIDWSRNVDGAAAIASPPSPADLLMTSAIAHHRAGRLDEALADYDGSIALTGPTADALNNRGCLRRDRGDLTGALADLDDAVRIAPDFAVAHVSRAEVLTARGAWDLALEALDRAIALDGSWRDHARTSEMLAKLREARPTAAAFRA